LDFERFHLDGFTEFRNYIADNAWFGFSNEPPDGPKGPQQSISTAWFAYDNVRKDRATPVILGDTKIRSNADLVRNFGLSSIDTVQEQESLQLLRRLTNERQAIASSAAPGAYASPAPGGAPLPGGTRPGASPLPVMAPLPGSAPLPGTPPLPGMASAASAMSRPGAAPVPGGAQQAIPVLGPGSILSTRSWSPMLNDAFIMGAAAKGHEFELALTDAEKSALDQVWSNQMTPQQNWRSFLINNPRTIWDASGGGQTSNGLPRVLARELIGLLTFGYMTKYEGRQLGFLRKQNTDPTFRQYVDALEKCEFQRNTKAKVLQPIAEFLFGSKTALDSI
jgi:hypothetical protein